MSNKQPAFHVRDLPHDARIGIVAARWNEDIVDELMDGCLRRLGELDATWKRRADTARAQGNALRYVATVTPTKIAVGLRAVPLSSPLASLKGSDNQLVFTTARYKANPLVIRGPGAGAEVTAAGVLNDILRLAGA